MVDDMKIINDQTYKTLKYVIEQDKTAKLPYYGPIARGWLGTAIYDNVELKDQIFCNPSLDVRPFFIYTSHRKNQVTVCLTLLGFSESKINSFVKTLTINLKGHFGGINCRVRSLKLESNKLEPYTVTGNRLTIGFPTPVALYKNNKIIAVPKLRHIVEFLTRSVNRYTKYYLKGFYPYHISDELKNINAKIDRFDIDTFQWNHRSKNGRIIELEGIWGEVVYSDIDDVDGLGQLLGLARFFHLGKYGTYGFGKMEVKV